MRTRINFPKVETFIEKINKTPNEFLDKLGINFLHWQKIEEDLPTSTASRLVSDEYLLKVSNEFSVDPRFFFKNTLRVVVNDILTLSWENTKNIDHDHIFHDSIGDLELTEAECILLFEGSQTGIADCTLQAQDKFEYGSKGQLSNTNVIRTEILEWLLMPSVTRLLVKSGGLTIIGTEIGSLSSSNHIATSLRKRNSALKISDAILDIDLRFAKCHFQGNLDFSNSMIQSLTFDGCTIRGNFNGNNITTNGDIRFFSPNKNAKNYLANPTFKVKDNVCDILGGISLYSASISGHLHLGEGLSVNGGINLQHMTSSMVISNNIKCFNENWSINLDFAKISGGILLGYCEFKGTISGAYLQCDMLDMSRSIIHKSVELTAATIKNLNFAGTRLLGSGVSFDASGLVANQVFMRDNFIALHGVELHKSKISVDADFSNSFIGKSDKGYALTLSGSSVQNIYLRSSIMIGTVFLQGSTILSKLDLTGGVFISASGHKLKALDCASLKASSEVIFNSQKASTLNIYSEINDQNNNRQDTTTNSTTPSKINAPEANIGLDRLTELRSVSVEEFKLLEKVILEDCYNDLDTIIIGEVSFESAEINGKIDFAGTLFHGTLGQEYCLEDSKNFINRIFTLLNTKVLGKFLIVFLLLIPALILFCYKIIAQFYIFIKHNRDVARRRLLINSLWRITIDDFISIKIHDNWPNALTLSFARISGDLFLNRGHNQRPFQAFGEVDLTSTKVDNFFVSPDLGSHSKTIWKVTGLKYDYIFSETGKGEYLEDCKWFFDYINDENYKQPYEQLASSYVKMGNDVSARKVLIKTPGKLYSEKVLMALLAAFAWLSIPPYRALVSLVVFWLLGSVLFLHSYESGEIIKAKDSFDVTYSPEYYSLHLLIPFIPNTQKESFSPSFRNDIPHSIYIPFRPNFIPKIIPEQVNFPYIYIYHTIHSIIGPILISLFLLGIARILRNS